MTLYKATLFASAALVAVQALVIDPPSVHSSDAGGGDGQPSWYHLFNHPVHSLFRRQNGIPTDGHDYPAVGSSGMFYNSNTQPHVQITTFLIVISC